MSATPLDLFAVARAAAAAVADGRLHRREAERAIGYLALGQLGVDNASADHGERTHWRRLKLLEDVLGIDRDELLALVPAPRPRPVA